MNLKKRLLYYGVGFIAGAIIVFFIWSKKEASFDYLPQARVLKDIKSKKLEISTDIKTEFNTYNIDSLSFTKLFDEADIDFSKSDTKAKPCKTYWINTNLKNIKFSLVVQNCDSIASIQRIVKE